MTTDDTLPTITIDGRTYSYTDTGHSWIIFSTAPLLDSIHDRIAGAYQRAQATAAERHEPLPASESRITMDVMVNDIAAVGTELGVRIYSDSITVPYTGEYRRASVESVAGTVEDQVLALVAGWVYNALHEHRQARATN
jgi:hypothetical protein